MGLGQYRIQYEAGHYTGPTPPQPQTFADLGIVEARIYTDAAGGDYADLTCNVSLSEGGMPFAPLAKHIIYDPAGNVCFVGVLTRPGRSADGGGQRQTFRLEGPSYWLQAVPYLQPWMFAPDPTVFDGGGSLTAIPLGRFILHRDGDGPINLRAQAKAILDYAIAQGAPIAYGDLTAIPAIVPPEDEQTDQKCLDALARVLRWAPMVVRRWVYESTTPTLKFSASGAATHIIVANNGTVTLLRNDPRYDLLVKKVTVHYVSESNVGGGRIWATLAVDTSEAENGSVREEVFTYDLRGNSVSQNEDGTPVVGKEDASTGLAAALHEPFKSLYNSVEWTTVGADVDWTTSLGQLVQINRVGGSGGGGIGLISLGVAAHSAIQKITRDLKTGTTSFSAGPPTTLGFSDLMALRMAGSASRNAARGRGGEAGGGYTAGFKGPETQKTGTLPTPSAGLGPRYYNGASYGLACFFELNGGPPLTELPDGATVQNPQA